MNFHSSEQRSTWLLIGAAATASVILATLYFQLRDNSPSTEETTSSASSTPKLDDCKLSREKSILLVLSQFEGFQEIINNFHGIVVTDLASIPSLSGKTVYLCGNVGKANDHIDKATQVFILREIAENFEETCSPSWKVVSIGRMPVDINGVGVYYRRFFDLEADFFNKINSQHVFQSLTESNKPGTAHRTGIYLSPVKKQGEDVHFNLLRCSTNLSGPTGRFQEQDTLIVNALNNEADCIFENQASLNHVLAQIYRNTSNKGAGKKATKAKIKDHSDKTKDMPTNGLMAFVTFYDQLELSELQPLDSKGFDYGIFGKKGEAQSALTKLNFRLKPCVLKRDADCQLSRSFSITLYPNSVFFMPLSTNRLYTHEIMPSHLDVAHIPTRMGYVVRCSDTEAVHRDGLNYLLKKKDAHRCLVKLQPPTQEGMESLRRLYAEENYLDSRIDYGEVLFSMNKGDYLKPLMYNLDDDFSWFSVPLPLSGGNSLFSNLMSSVKFENMGKGRLGTVLVDVDAARGTPIVRTTSKYTTPARGFQQLHRDLVRRIKAVASLPCDFNNALVENYSHAYTTMGFHSDQTLDLEDNTFIALYSCYKYPENKLNPSRKLVIESKDPNGGVLVLPLNHNSVVIFSTETNKHFKHKIILDQNAQPDKGQEWLGVTLRTSKTFVQYTDSGARFEDGSALILADNAQTKEFYKLRGLENAQADYSYPFVPYTISASDLLQPDVKQW